MSDAEQVEEEIEISANNGNTNRCVNVTLQILFSTPGLVVLVVMYSVMGALIFPLLEAPNELHTALSVSNSREECLKELWTITETLRKHSPFGFITRRCVKDYTIPDTNMVIEKGTQIIISVDGLQTDPKYYRDPLEFIPERFEEEKVPFVQRPFLAFGDGPRNCIGFRFSKIQTKLGLVLLLRKFRFELSEVYDDKELELHSRCLAKLPTLGINLKVYSRH